VVPDADAYDLRVNNERDGWTPPELSPLDAIVDGYRDTRYVFDRVVSGDPYGWWIHAVNGAGASPATGGPMVVCGTASFAEVNVGP